MNEQLQLVVFRLDDQRYGLPLSAVERIVQAAEVTPLPKAPAIVLGVVDVGGRVLPVLNIRRRFRLPEREAGITDQFLIARTARRTVVLVIDEAQSVIERRSSDVIGADQIVQRLEHVRGVVSLNDGLVLIHDLETFLSLDEAQALDQAMSQEVAHGA